MESLGSRNVDVITLFVEDFQKVKAFYQEVFGFQAVYEDEVSSVFNFGNMSVNLLDISESHELMKPGTVATRESGFRFLLTIWVDDVDEACEELKKRGVALLNGPIDRPWGVRTASFVDPAGHAWEIAKQICC
ncbi:glyoxalase/bleomycin resistance/dioxygenase family protein [Brevibacillus sp. HB1.2]|uniref:VOC family protein n=1 Tax=Brevibacillus TaxID=55080 RepID=UPI0003814AC9|nr:MULTISPECIES: VOC family protein [unclassified Brevibacillus]ATF14839.1 glyoxalase/bleomycin resistance/dioxygenase family protein [Brevibacillus brevis X23]NRS19317.1 VOC family protein [Brevibacillus sp. HB1.4B]NTU22711.1 glyoxalase/bleomycin resistance/dioxygenase family protein [Brevibacillus sp. HB1.2]NTU32880.1 glyoxalase/bleomycin resistance/dioxygenase family protein [Brevibacillus sp. HB1.1]